MCAYFAPFVGTKTEKKDRLLRHIETKHREQQLQDSPLDLTSPMKETVKLGNASNKKADGTQSEALDLTSPTKEETNTLETKQGEPLDLSAPDKIGDTDVCQTAVEPMVKSYVSEFKKYDNLELCGPAYAGRENYPFDDNEEPYASEFEEGE